MADKTTAETVANIADKVSQVGSGSAFFFGLSAVDFAAIIGAAVAVLGFLLNWHYKNKHFKMVQESLRKSQGHHRQGDISPELEKINSIGVENDGA